MMVTYCFVRGCENNSDSARPASKPVSFHEFPKEPQLRQKWLQAVGRPQWDPPSHIRICSDHFSKDQLRLDGPMVQIKEGAFPTNLPANPIPESSNEEVCRVCLATDVKMFSLQHGALKLCMELIKTNVKSNMEGLPQVVCYECRPQMLNYFRLIKRTIIANSTLIEILESNGQITKHLVKQKDRNQLHLNSNIGLARPNAFVAVVNIIDNTRFGDHVSKEETAHNSLKKNKDVCEKVLRKATKNRTDSIRTRKNNTKVKNKSNNDSDSIIQDVIIENEPIRHIEINVTCKSEAVDDNDFHDMESSANDTIHVINPESVHSLSSNYKPEACKIEFEKADCCKIEKFDSEPDDLSDGFKIDFKTENNEPYDPGKIHSEIKKNINLEYIGKSNKQIKRKSKKQNANKSDSIIFESVITDSLDGSSDESDESLDLMSLKNSVKRKKLAKSSDIKSKNKKTATRKKKRSEKEPPGEAAIGKLNCYKIVNLTLQEQISEWKNENEQTIHTRDQVFECDICTKKFLRKKAYEQHLSYHKPSRGDIECPVCKERFQSKTRLNAHTTRTHAKRYECTKCPKVLNNLIRARRHELQHSGQVYACAHCSYSSRHRSAAWEHARRQHPHRWHCARCGHAFINAKGLAQHRAIAHPAQEEEPKTPFPCEQCNIVFHSEGALRVHQFTSKLHENPDEPPPPVDQALKLSCKRCGASFAKRRDLWEHAQKEHNWVSRPSLRKRGVPLEQRTCEHCDKEIKTRFEYWCHLRREHPSLKHTYRRVVTAVCDKCGKGFNNASLLKVHSLSHGAATHACARCPRVFHDPHALARHAYSHTPDRPHACRDCGRAFKLKGNLDRHMRTHTGETPYECSFCGKKFKYWSSMNEHEKHMHQKIPWPPRDRRPAATKKSAEHELL